MSLPSLLLVHGAWQGPDCWQPLLGHLADVDVRTVALPSSGPDPEALGDLYDDAAVLVEALAATDAPTVVLGHSYGGCPVSQAAGAAGDVLRVIYLSAMMQDVGDALLTVTGGAYPSFWRVHERPDGGTGGHFTVSHPETALYNGVRPDVARRYGARLGRQSLASVTQPLTRAAWRSVPSTYLLCESDNAIPLPVQARMARHADRTRTLRCGHAPYLSQPAELARVLRQELAVAGRP